MELVVERPKVEPRFQAEVYRTLQDEKEVYRIVIGREGTEVPRKVGRDFIFIDYHEISYFMNRTGIENWVNEQVRLLKFDGKRVEFDDSPSYKMARVIDELASESECFEGE